jgi:hypothetical protein
MSALDPVLLSLLSIFGGVLVTVLGGFLGAWIQHRRAHRAWLRERRYEAYVGAYALNKSFDLNRFKTSKIAARGEASVAEWESADRDAMTPAEIEAPESKMADIRRLVAEADDLYSTVATVRAPVILIGSPSVARHVYDMQAAYESDDDSLGKAALRS